MAVYPAQLEREQRLADGRTVLIRPVRPDDEARESAFLATLSPRARRMRFQRGAGALDASVVRFHTHVDYDRHMAFVATAGTAREERLVGEARYLAHADCRGCELGIVVGEDWRHSGLAQRLMEALLDAARRRGFERMEGSALRENRDMLDFARELGFRVDAAPEDPETVRIVKEL